MDTQRATELLLELKRRTELPDLGYRPRSFQLHAHEATERRKLLICHRRAGKTVFAVNEMIQAIYACRYNEPRAYYIAPYHGQAKRIAWDMLKAFSRPIGDIKINESELRIDYPNGGRITLLGAENAEAIRGTYSDLTVMDEYSQIAPGVYGSIIRPTLSDRKGKLIVCGTPSGRNHFYDLYQEASDSAGWYVGVHPASETGIVDAEELAEAKQDLSKDMYAQEYECSFTAATQGSYYADVIKSARDGGRITKLPVETIVPVHVAVDLGMNDTTALVFFQAVGREIRIIDCYENSGEGLDHYARVIRERGYLYGDFYLPHDVEVRELTSGKSRKETLESLGVRPITVVPRVRDINEGIEQTRQLIPRCWFDPDGAKDLIRALENYRKEWDDKRQVFRSRPLHDWSSNYSDAFRQIAQGFSEEADTWGEPIKYDFAGII